MLPKIDPTKTLAWKELQKHYLVHQKTDINVLFNEDAQRFEKMSFEMGDLLFDFSKNNATDETLELLTELAVECKLSDSINAMFRGDHINETEDRAVLHTALRSFSKNEISVNGENITPLIEQERKRIEQICKDVHSGSWKGCTGKKIKYIVNIGIGGSDLGASMVTEALKPYWITDVKPFFISNIDGSNVCEVLKEIQMDETLFIVASKTFTTQETMTNARTIRRLFVEQFNDEKLIAHHFVAVTGNKQKANEFGIPNEQIFEIWDWVCVRFSLWGSMGLPIALTVGYAHFEALLRGANQVDTHFKTTPFQQNIPVIMALLSIWYINFFNTQSEAVLSYDHYLSKFKSYLQQGAMESNGKSVDRNGLPIPYQTAVVVWGETGTNGQHSFHQLLHQGTQLIPCDFIIPVHNTHGYSEHNEKLLCNAFAQTEALMKGRTIDAVATQNVGNKNNSNQYKVFAGNKPSNSILLKELTPYNLGSLIAVYEHKTFVQGIIWNIFSFDQWGVELGKELSSAKLSSIRDGKEETLEFDASTNGLMDQMKSWISKNAEP